MIRRAAAYAMSSSGTTFTGPTRCGRRAAEVYIYILSEPQLFIAGNHRTGALVLSYILAREGRPPFVLTA
jgi:hypothetical protein